MALLEPKTAHSSRLVDQSPPREFPGHLDQLHDQRKKYILAEF